MDSPHEKEVVIRMCLHSTRRISIISTLRARRPSLYEGKGRECPFCPGREHMTPKATLVLVKSSDELVFTDELSGEIRRDWLVRIFPNRYPALLPDPVLRPSTRGVPSPYGYHEVLVESRIHDEGEYLSEWVNVYYALLALRERARQLMMDEYIEYFIAIKNGGAVSGASVPHPHMQLFALTFTPPEVVDEVSVFRGVSKCPLCSMGALSDLVVYESEYFLLTAAPAPRVPYEMHVVPKKHSPSFISVSDEELEDLGRVLRLALLAVRDYLKVDYNFWLHTAPKGVDRYHWHIEVLPATIRWGGFEKGSGVYLTTVMPEDAASKLRGFISEAVS
ncbi:MAG: hypothetical protein J7L51_03170 [Desulfurococcales archaeon]|nr:hypothetical protein [Desulfurococcales archaeon]